MAIYRRERSTRLLVIGLVLASLMTITLDFRGGERGPLAAVGRLAFAVVSPLQEGLASVFRPIGAFFSDIARVGSLRAENEALQQRIEEFGFLQSQVLELRAENKELKELLDLRAQLDLGETVGAYVIAESVNNFEASITIDRGSSDGIEVGMPVIASKGLVGRIVEVAPDQAKVLLIIDSNSSVDVRLASTRENAVLEGQRERDMRLSLVNRGTVVQPGEQVVTSGRSSVFPPAIPVGIVSQALPEEVAAERVVLVRPVVDFSRLAEVLVVVGSAGARPQR